MTENAARLAGAFAGTYDIDREIGRGGMATVYLATDVKHVDPGTRGGLSLAAVPVEGGEPRWLLDNLDRNAFVGRDPGTGELYFTRIPITNQFVTVDIGEILDRFGRTGGRD
jgi:hypothetical protein